MEISTVIRFVFACMENTMLLAVHFKGYEGIKKFDGFSEGKFPI